MPDVFISYCHTDDLPTGPHKNAWVSIFVEDLQNRLNALSNLPVDIYFDVQTRGQEILDKSIDERLKKTKILLVVSTPRFHRSNYCAHELQEFLRVHGNPALIPNSTTEQRVIKVSKTYVPFDDQCNRSSNDALARAPLNLPPSRSVLTSG